MKAPTAIDLDSLARVHGGGAAFDPSKSDGCTGAPDGWWGSACKLHDQDRWNASTPQDRKASDGVFYQRMLDAGAPPAVAGLYYYGVRSQAVFKDTMRRWGVLAPGG